MDTENLMKIITLGESQEVEFKESFHSNQDISEIMCGFVNTSGGVIIIGVNKNKEMIGITKDLDDIQQRISSSAQAIDPAIIPDIKIHIINSKNIISIVIQKATDSQLYTYKGIIYVRVGSTTKKIEGSQMVDFLRAKQILVFDETPTDAKITDLDTNKIKQYLNTRNQNDYLDNHSVEDFLISTKLATKNGFLKIKNSALVIFAKNPIFFNPQLEIKLVRFETNEPVNIISHELVQADLVEGISRSLLFIRSNISKEIKITESKREEIFEYPLEVVREAIVNAVAHRDYFSKDAIQLYLFPNRVEITNPGSIPRSLPKELFGTLSVQRNPLIYKILRDLGFVEGLGSGIPRMINGMRKHNLRDPEFGIYEQFYKITLYNKKSSNKPITEIKDLNQRQIKAIEFMNSKNNILKTKTYMQINKISNVTSIKEINELINLGYLEKVGSFRGVYYILKKTKE